MRSEKIFKGTLRVSSILMLALLVGIFITLLIGAIPSIRFVGLKFIYGQTWDPVFEEYGALPFLVGTLATSFLALIISIPFSLGIALFLGEYFREGTISSTLRSLIELLAGIPSVVYGFWGLFFLVPIIRAIEMKVGAAPYGVGILTSSIILAVMIIPYSASIAREVIALVPADIKEAAYSLGATRFEVIIKVIIPYARSGIMAGVLLSLGRALGETMAVTMLIGNSNFLPKSIFAPSNTMASVIANEFTEAVGDVYLSALIQIALLLMIVTTIINIIGKYVIKRFQQVDDVKQT
jgi:phosphate transport system permease protein